MTVDATAPRAKEHHLRSLVKGVSWRVVGSMDTFILSLLVTGSLKSAGAVASFEVFTKIVLFYLHERGWKLIPWGRDGNDAPVALKAEPV